MINRTKHPANLPFPALAKAHLQLAGKVIVLEDCNFIRDESFTFVMNPAFQRGNLSLAQTALHLDQIVLLNFKTWMRQAQCEITVVCQKQQSGGVLIEPSHTIQTPKFGWQEIK